MKKKLLGIKRKPPGSFSSNRWQFVPIRFRSICSTHSSLVRYADDALLVCRVTRTNAFLSWPYGKKETNTNTKFCWLWRLHLCGINKELNLQSLSYKWCKANTRHYHIFWLSYKYMYKCLPKRNAQQDHHHHHKDVLNIHGYTNSYHSNHNKSSKKGFASFSVLERGTFSVLCALSNAGRMILEDRLLCINSSLARGITGYWFWKAVNRERLGWYCFMWNSCLLFKKCVHWDLNWDTMYIIA